MSTIEVLSRVQARPEPVANHSKEALRRFARILIRILSVVIIVVLAIAFPAFDRIMALMGSCLCFTICIILPVTFYLRIYGEEIGHAERILDWILLTVSSVLAAVGTVWAFLPMDAMFGSSIP